MFMRMCACGSRGVALAQDTTKATQFHKDSITVGVSIKAKYMWKYKLKRRSEKLLT